MSVIGSKYRGTQAYHFVHCRLITAAQRREELRYADIVSILGIATTGHHMAREVGQVLGEISEDEHDAGRPMLSALVVSAVTQSPGSGFYTLARQLGLLAADLDAYSKQGPLEDKPRSRGTDSVTFALPGREGVMIIKFLCLPAAVNPRG